MRWHEPGAPNTFRTSEPAGEANPRRRDPHPVHAKVAEGDLALRPDTGCGPGGRRFESGRSPALANRDRREQIMRGQAGQLRRVSLPRAERGRLRHSSLLSVVVHLGHVVVGARTPASAPRRACRERGSIRPVAGGSGGQGALTAQRAAPRPSPSEARERARRPRLRAGNCASRAAFPTRRTR
jgi:hypothetical protein